MSSPTIVTAAIAAINAGDTDTFLDLFAETGSVDDWGTIYRGRAQIKTWSDRELIGAKAHFTLKSSTQHGHQASMMVEVGGKGFNGPSRFTFDLDGDKVRRMKISAD
jgi:hypothetical protein